MLTHNTNQSIQNIIKNFQHSHSNLNLNDNQILQHIRTLQKITQIYGGEKNKINVTNH
jgi:ABC-type transporter Mla subunit MlaD